MIKIFENSAQQGLFGEFVYKYYCENQGFEVLRTNYCHTDFLVNSSFDNNFYFVDVKTSIKNKKSYSGKRFHEEISYELILILSNEVFLVPDEKSPLKKLDRIFLGRLSELIQVWKNSASIVNSNKGKYIIDDNTLANLKEEFSKSIYKKVRIIERGEASTSRWDGKVDNLPGSNAIMKKFDATVFIQYACFDFKQVARKIFLIPHELLCRKQVKMTTPNERQKKKGIFEVIDLQGYENDYQCHVFKDHYGLNNFLKSLK